LILVGWNADPDPDPGGAKRPTKIEKEEKFKVLKGCSLLRTEGSCGLDVLYESTGISKLQYLIYTVNHVVDPE
jgi:hypothetical protein